MMRPSVALPTGTLMPSPVLLAIEVAAQAVGRTERDRAHDAVAELLLHFERDRRRAFDFQRVVHLRHLVARKFDVDDRADDLNYFALTHVMLKMQFVCSSPPGEGLRVVRPSSRYGCATLRHIALLGERIKTAAAPPTISEISCVIAA